MVLEFREFKKKISRKRFLTLDFSLEFNNTLAVINPNENILELLKKSFLLKTKFDGKILINENDIKSGREVISVLDIGLYKNFSIYKNFKLLLALLSEKVDKEEFKNLLVSFNLDSRLKVKRLTDFELLKVQMLFAFTICESVVLFDKTNIDLEDSEACELFELVKSLKKENHIFVLLDNKFSNVSKKTDYTVAIKDDKVEYFDKTKKLRILENLVELEFSNTSGVIDVLERENISYFESENKKLIIRSSDVESLVYNLLKIDIDVVSIQKYSKILEEVEKENV